MERVTEINLICNLTEKPPSLRGPPDFIGSKRMFMRSVFRKSNLDGGGGGAASPDPWWEFSCSIVNISRAQPAGSPFETSTAPKAASALMNWFGPTSETRQSNRRTSALMRSLCGAFIWMSSVCCRPQGGERFYPKAAM